MSTHTDAPEAPIRTWLHTVSPEEIARLNQKEGRTGARAFEGAEAAIMRMRTAKRTTRERLDSWVNHPDERVLVYLLEQWKEQERSRMHLAHSHATVNLNIPVADPRRSGRLADAHRVLADRIWAAAEEEGRYWSPVLERLCDATRRDAMSAPGRDVYERCLDRLKGWVRQEQNPRATEALFAFPSTSTLTLHAGRVDQDLAAAICEKHGLHHTQELALNPHLEPEAVAYLLHYAMEWIEEELKESTPRLLDEHALIVSRLDETGYPIPQRHVDRLHEIALEHHRVAPFAAALSGASPAQLRGLYGGVEDTPRRLGEALALNPNTPSEVLRELAAGGRSRNVFHRRGEANHYLDRLARNPVARTDTAIRACMRDQLEHHRPLLHEAMFVGLLIEAEPGEAAELCWRAAKWYDTPRVRLQSLLDGAGVDLAKLGIELWPRFGKEHLGARQLAALSLFPALRRSPAFCEKFLQVGQKIELDAWIDLVGDAPVDFVGPALNTLLQHSPEHVVRALELHENVRAAATPQLVAKLLRTDDAQIRQRAICLLPKLRGHVTPSRPNPTVS